MAISSSRTSLSNWSNSSAVFPMTVEIIDSSVRAGQAIGSHWRSISKATGIRQKQEKK